MQRTRRTALVTVATTLSGCATVVSRPEPAFPLRATVAEFTVKTPAPLQTELTLEPSEITPEATATLVVRTTWNGSRELLIAGNGVHSVIGSPSYSSPSGTVLAHSTNAVVPEENREWVADKVGIFAAADPVTIAPGKSRTDTYDLWADGDHTDLFEPGAYTFTRKGIELRAGDRVDPARSRLTLRVESV